MPVPTEASVRAQIDRILKSEAFRSAESLRRLLAFLGDRTLDGTADGLKEYSIGRAVFGKPESYNPQVDASVRVQIGKLRQRLEVYYRSEGQEDPVVVDLPHRQFVLRTREREDAPVAAAPPVRAWWRIPAVLAVVLVSGTAGWLLRGPASGRPAAPAPEIRAFWKPFLDSQKPPLICLGTPLFLRFRGARVRYADSMEDARDDPTVKKMQELFGDSSPIPAYEYTGIGEATATFLLTRLFSGWGHPVEVRRDSALNWDDIRSNNLIFLGSAKFNPHMREWPVEQNFTVEGGGVKNLKPAPGEPAVFGKVRVGDRELAEDHALISRIPGLDGRSVIVWLGGSATWSTWGAADCLVEPEHFRNVLGRMRDPRTGEIPKFFELVVKVQFRDLVPVNLAYVTHRVVAGPRQHP
jgi:hypothetical protein